MRARCGAAGRPPLDSGGEIVYNRPGRLRQEGGGTREEMYTRIAAVGRRGRAAVAAEAAAGPGGAAGRCKHCFLA